MMYIRKVLIGLAAVFILLGVFYVGKTLLSIGNSDYKFNVSSETVIKEIRSLNRLETAQFTIEKVIDAGTSGNRFQEFLFGDSILLIAHGSIIAGIDLSEVQKEDISVDSDTLRVDLPAPQIFVTHLDPTQTRVYDRQTGVLSKGDKDLESEARREAEKILTEAACIGGILDEASDNARSQLTTLFKGFQFKTVIFNIPQGSC